MGGVPTSSGWGFRYLNKKNCEHCPTAAPYEDVLKPDEHVAGPHSQVHMMWSTHLEIVPLTQDIGGWEPPSFHEKIAEEAINGWMRFRDVVAPGLPKNHPLAEQTYQSHAGALNDGFFHYQKRLFEAQGHEEEALRPDPGSPPTPPPWANSSWG